MSITDFKEHSELEYFKQICTKDNLKGLCAKVASAQKTKITGTDQYLKDFCSAKVVSEIVSNFWENFAAPHFSEIVGSEVLNATNDNQADLTFTESGNFLEIKVTSGEEWRGGKFSKRESCYLLIARDKDDCEKCFIALAYIPKEEWKLSSKSKKTGKENYYATSIGKKELLELVNQGKAYVIVGGLSEQKTKQGNPFKVRRVKLSKVNPIFE